MTPREKALVLCGPIKQHLPEDVFEMFVDDITDGLYFAALDEREACAATVEWSRVGSLSTADGQLSDTVRSELAAAIRGRAERK